MKMDLKEIKREELADRIFHIPDIQEFSLEQATKKIFFETDFLAGAVWTMLPGQELPIHSHASADDIWIVIAGEAEYYNELDEKVQIQKGDVVLARPKEKHGMKNVSDELFIMLGIAGPIPIGYICHKDEQCAEKL